VPADAGTCSAVTILVSQRRLAAFRHSLLRWLVACLTLPSMLPLQGILGRSTKVTLRGRLAAFNLGHLLTLPLYRGLLYRGPKSTLCVQVLL